MRLLGLPIGFDLLVGLLAGGLVIRLGGFHASVPSAAFVLQVDDLGAELRLLGLAPLRFGLTLSVALVHAAVVIAGRRRLAFQLGLVLFVAEMLLRLAVNAARVIAEMGNPFSEAGAFKACVDGVRDHAARPFHFPLGGLENDRL